LLLPIDIILKIKGEIKLIFAKISIFIPFFCEIRRFYLFHFEKKRATIRKTKKERKIWKTSVGAKKGFGRGTIPNLGLEAVILWAVIVPTEWTSGKNTGSRNVCKRRIES
jgi:hypothetical protein